jgi:hypothetical protein
MMHLERLLRFVAPTPGRTSLRVGGALLSAGLLGLTACAAPNRGPAGPRTVEPLAHVVAPTVDVPSHDAGAPNIGERSVAALDRWGSPIGRVWPVGRV